MNTLQLLHVIQVDPKSRTKFCGVYAADTLPNVIHHYPCGLIVNTDPISEQGSHWLAMYFPSNDVGEFFDSYGYPPEFYKKNFKMFLNSHTKTWTYNPRCLQSLNSSTCGQFCLYFIMNRNRGKTLQSIVRSFSNDRSLNDHRVSVFVGRHLIHYKKKTSHRQISMSRRSNVNKPLQ